MPQDQVQNTQPAADASPEFKENTAQAKHVHAKREVPDITTAFKDGVSLNSTSTPEVLLNYVETCARMLFIHPHGPNHVISEQDYEVKKYYTTRCIDVIFGGNYKYEAPEPIYVDNETEEKKDEDEKKDEEKKDEPQPEVTMAEFRPRVMRMVVPEELKFQVPAEYQETKDAATVPIPVMVKKDDTHVEIKSVVKLESELTDQDKAFLKNRYMAVMHGMYRKFVEASSKFEALCVRGKELVRKMTTRRSRRCFKTTINHSEEGATNLELIPNPKGNNDLKNINMWYAEFVQIYGPRGGLWRSILNIVGEMHKLQDSPTWKAIVGEPIFDWKQRLEKFVLAPGKDDLLRFIKDSKLTFDQEQNEKDADPIKDGVMFHFFNVSPKIIVQLAIAKPTGDGLFGDEQLRKEADTVVE